MHAYTGLSATTDVSDVSMGLESTMDDSAIDDGSCSDVPIDDPWQSAWQPSPTGPARAPTPCPTDPTLLQFARELVAEIGFAAAPARLQDLVHGRPLTPFRDNELSGIQDPDVFYQNRTGNANLPQDYRRGGVRPSPAQVNSPSFRAPTFSDGAPDPVPLPGCDFDVKPYCTFDHDLFRRLVEGTDAWGDHTL